MGLGTKIKEVLHGDKDQQYGSADISRTPGSFPSEEVPRTHHKGDTYDTNIASEHTTDKLPGKSSSDYTYGSGTGRHGRESPKGESGVATTYGTAGTTTSHSKKLSKGSKDPYWGDSGRLDQSVLGDATGTGSFGLEGGNPHARDVNDRYNQTAGAHTSGTSHDVHPSRLSGTNDSMLDPDRDYRGTNVTHPGTTGSAGYTTGASEGAHGPHTSRVANAADPRVDSDRDHRAAPSSNLGGSGNYAGTTGVGRLSSQDYDTTRTTHDTTRTAHVPAGGVTSNLAHRPHDTDNTARRDYKTDEYDAPSSSAGRGHHGAVAGAGAGVAAGYGASKLADRHHEHELPQHRASPEGYSAGRQGNAPYDNVGLAHSSNNNNNRTSGTTEPGMLDPYAKTSTGGTSTGGSNTYDSGYAARSDNASIGSSEYAQGGARTQGSDSGREHFGPGHEGAKVMHRCYNCGADNDISKHFRKDAVYRMG